jgi:hypothetical protein
MVAMRLGVACAALLVATLCLADLSAGSGSESFSDPVGDSGVAPDITNVTVANDDDGLLTFRIALANRTSLGPDDTVAVLIATDDPNPHAGRRFDGTNFAVVLDGTNGPSLHEWNGVDLDPINPRPASVTGSFTNGVVTLTVQQEDLAPGFPDLSVPIQLQFYAVGVAFHGTDVVAVDRAPGSDFYPYRLAEPLRVVVTNFAPKKVVRAGKTLLVLMGEARADTGAPVRSGSVRCRARLGSAALRGKGGFVTIKLKSPVTGEIVTSRNAACSWHVPRTAKGKTIQGAMTVTESGITNTRSFTTRVR